MLDFLYCLIPVAMLAIFIFFTGVRMLYQYERGVVFTLGKFNSIREPGLNFIFPVLQTMRKVDIRIKTAEVPRQEVITKDNIPI